MLTQRERLFDDVSDIKKKKESMRIARILLRKLLGEAQNPPPEGGADGTVDPVLWTLTSGLVKALDDVDYFIEGIESQVRVRGKSGG